MTFPIHDENDMSSLVSFPPDLLRNELHGMGCNGKEKRQPSGTPLNFLHSNSGFDMRNWRNNHIHFISKTINLRLGIKATGTVMEFWRSCLLDYKRSWEICSREKDATR